MVLNNVSQLKHIKLTKHMHYCIQKIYHVYYTTQWNFIILRKFRNMTLTSPNEKWMRVADKVQRFGHFLLWTEEFCFDVVGNFEPKKITPNCNALAKSIISYLWVYYYTCYLQTKKHAVTSSERTHSITWYKQKRRRNRWASKKVSRRYLSYVNILMLWTLTYTRQAAGILVKLKIKKIKSKYSKLSSMSKESPAFEDNLRLWEVDSFSCLDVCFSVLPSLRFCDILAKNSKRIKQKCLGAPFVASEFVFDS